MEEQAYRIQGLVWQNSHKVAFLAEIQMEILKYFLNEIWGYVCVCIFFLFVFNT